MVEAASQESIERLKEYSQEQRAVHIQNTGEMNLARYLAHYDITFKIKNSGPATLYVLDHCIFNSEHGRGESAIGQMGDGALFYKCFHQSCQQYKWNDARQAISGDVSVKEFIEGRIEADQTPANGATWSRISECLESWNSIRNMEIIIEWVVDRLIPRNSITLVFGKGGIGKTWLLLAIARCIGLGDSWLGFHTIQASVFFIDFENPLAVLNIRTNKLGEAENVYFWRSNNPELKAPRLDSKDWEHYKQLPAGSVLIFDTLRASQGGDENASDAMARVMNRLKELRDMGFTVILLHHTAKNSDKVAKGSTAIVDLADHILGLTLVRKKKDGEDDVIEDDESSDDVLYKFGVREKTRFEPYHVYLTLNPDVGFELAPDPQESTLKGMRDTLLEVGSSSKTSFIDKCSHLNIGKSKLRKLFDIGVGRYWKVDKGPEKNIHLVTPIQLSSFSPLYSSGKLKNWDSVIQDDDEQNDPQTPSQNEFSSFPKDGLKTEKQKYDINEELQAFQDELKDDEVIVDVDNGHKIEEARK